MHPSNSQQSVPDAGDPVVGSDLFRSFPPEAHSELLAALEPVALPAGSMLFEQGAPGDSMYLIRRGRVGVSMHVDDLDQLVTEYGPGASVGELALITGKPRVARVSILDDSELLRLTHSRFTILAERYPQAINQFTTLLLPRMRRAQSVGVLTGLFGQLNPTILNDIANELEWRRLASGTELFRQGDPGDSFAIVVTGRLRIVVAGADQQQRIVSELGRGQYVGELAVLTNEPRSATVIAIRDTDIVLLSKQAFDRLLRQYPHVMMQITRVVVERLRKTTSAPMPAPDTRGMSIAIVALHNDLSLVQLADGLALALASAGPTMHLSSSRLDTALDRPGQALISDDHPAALTLNSWLSERETEHSYMLYQADPQQTAWTTRCLRRADLVLLIGQASAPSAITPIEAHLEQIGVRARRELVLLHQPGTTSIVGTQRWLTARLVSAHYHIRVTQPNDIARLARMATGRGIGLVLSGGGARGFAHIGVIRALEEAGIMPDAIGGSSFGALIGALYAHGLSWQAIDRQARELLPQWRVPDYTLPLVALLRGDRLTRTLRELFGETQIEDLWRSFFCLSVNLTRLSVMVHRQGPLWRFLRASTSLPLIFPPLLEHGEILVDGGLMDNLPAETMRTTCPQGLVIGVDVSQETGMNRPYRFGPSVSGWQVLLNRFRPREQHVIAPSVIETLLRVLEFNAVTSRHVNATYTDLLIRPAVERYGTLEFSAYETIVEIGYRAAQQQIAAWQRDSLNV